MNHAPPKQANSWPRFHCRRNRRERREKSKSSACRSQVPRKMLVSQGILPLTSTAVSAWEVAKNLRFVKPGSGHDHSKATDRWRAHEPIGGVPGGRWSAARTGDQHRADLLRGGRPAEPPTLSEVASDRRQPALLRRRFDAFGGHRRSE